MSLSGRALCDTAIAVPFLKVGYQPQRSRCGAPALARALAHCDIQTGKRWPKWRSVCGYMNSLLRARFGRDGRPGAGRRLRVCNRQPRGRRTPSPGVPQDQSGRTPNSRTACRPLRLITPPTDRRLLLGFEGYCSYNTEILLNRRQFLATHCILLSIKRLTSR